jgi:hypothetical protein
LSEEVKTGEVDPNLWIALEDLHDGWERSGEVGQEVYGAGNAFGILPRHYMQVKEAGLMIFTDYPTYGFAPKKHRPVSFRMAGDGRLSCRMLIVHTEKGKLPVFKVTVDSYKEEIKGKPTKDGHLEYELPGNGRVTIKWK